MTKDKMSEMTIESQNADSVILTIINAYENGEINWKNVDLTLGDTLCIYKEIVNNLPAEVLESIYKEMKE